MTGQEAATVLVACENNGSTASNDTTAPTNKPLVTQADEPTPKIVSEGEFPSYYTVIDDPQSGAGDTHRFDHDARNGDKSVLVLGRRWPSELLRLISQAQGDEWPQCLQRIHDYPHEIMTGMAKWRGTALHGACIRFPPLHIIQAMIVAAPQAVLWQNYASETPLHIAASSSASEEVQMELIKAGPPAVLMGDRYGDCPLHFAARNAASFELIFSMLQAAPKSLSSENKRGVTPFWLLPRSYLQVESLDEIIGPTGDDGAGDNDGNGAEEEESDEEEDFDDDSDREVIRQDWELLVLFLRFSYFPTGQEPPPPSVSSKSDNLSHSKYYWLLAAAAGESACPRETLRFLCRLFPHYALDRNSDGLTPLLRATQVPERAEPTGAWDELEDGYRESIDVFEGEIVVLGDNVVDQDLVLHGGDTEFIRNLAESPVDTESQADSDENVESVVEILLQWCPRAASVPCPRGQYPLAYALQTGLRFRAVKALLSSWPRALDSTAIETEDGEERHFPLFYCAALHSPSVDTVYIVLRSLPGLLQAARLDAA